MMEALAIVERKTQSRVKNRMGSHKLRGGVIWAVGEENGG